MLTDACLKIVTLAAIDLDGVDLFKLTVQMPFDGG